MRQHHCNLVQEAYMWFSLHSNAVPIIHSAQEFPTPNVSAKASFCECWLLLTTIRIDTAMRGWLALPWYLHLQHWMLHLPHLPHRCNFVMWARTHAHTAVCEHSTHALHAHIHLGTYNFKLCNAIGTRRKSASKVAYYLPARSQQS